MTESLFKIPKWESGDVFDPTTAINAINTMHDRQQKIRENATTIFNNMMKTAQTNKQQELKSYIDAFDLKQLSSPETKSEIFDKINQTNQELGGFSAETLKGLNDYVNFGRSEELMRQWGIKDAYYTKEAELNTGAAVQIYKDLFNPTANQSPENKAALETGLAQLFNQGMDDGNPENDVYFNKAFNEAATKALTNLNTQYTTQASLDESIISMFKPQVQEYMDAKLELDVALNSTDDKTKLSKADYDKGIAALDEQYGYLTPILNNPSIMARIQNKIKEEEVKKLTEEEKAALNKRNIESQINRREVQNNTDQGNLALGQNKFIYNQGKDVHEAQQDAVKKVEKENKDAVNKMTLNVESVFAGAGLKQSKVNAPKFVTADGKLNGATVAEFLVRAADNFSKSGTASVKGFEDFDNFASFQASNKASGLHARVDKKMDQYFVSPIVRSDAKTALITFIRSQDASAQVKIAFYNNFANGIYDSSFDTMDTKTSNVIDVDSFKEQLQAVWNAETPKISQGLRESYVGDAKKIMGNLIDIANYYEGGSNAFFRDYGKILYENKVYKFLPPNSSAYKAIMSHKGK